MTITTYEFDRIHSAYQKRLKYNKLIPCNCPNCANAQEPHFYAFETLQQFLGDRQKAIQCQRSYEMVDVAALIDNVFDRSLKALLPRDQLFVSYSHGDREWLDRLIVMLKPLSRSRQIRVWADTFTKAGSRWRDELEAALDLAKVAVLLVSPNFLASDFIVENELPSLLTAAKERGLTILWVPISDSLYKETEIAEFQAATDPSKPLDSLSPAEVNRVLVNICEQIKEAANS